MKNPIAPGGLAHASNILSELLAPVLNPFGIVTGLASENGVLDHSMIQVVIWQIVLV